MGVGWRDTLRVNRPLRVVLRECTEEQLGHRATHRAVLRVTGDILVSPGGEVEC